MRKKLTILIPLLAVFIFIAIAGTITIAGSNTGSSTPVQKTDPNALLEQANALSAANKYSEAEKLYLQIKAENPGSDKALEAQKQIVHMAIAQRDQKKADAAFDSMVAEFSKNKNVPGAIHQIGREYKELNKEKAFKIHRYNVENFTDDVHAMWSQVEIVQMYIEDGNSAADIETDKMINTFKDQPTLAKEIYQLAGKYNYAGKRTKANTLYAHASKYSPDDMYVQLSQIYCDIQNKDSNAVDTHLASLMAKQAGNSKLSKESGRRRDFSRRPPTPPYVRFRIRRFI